MNTRFEALAATVSREITVPITQILLLRHASENLRLLLREGGSVEEYTALQPTGSIYDFLHSDREPVLAVIVIVQDRVYDVCRVAGVEAKGTTYSLASAEHRAFDIARHRTERPAKRFRLESVPSHVVGLPIRGWERRARTPVQRADGGFFHEVEVVIPGEGGDSAAELRNDLEQIELASDEPETTRIALAQARLGQGRFRQDLMILWGGACAVTGSDVTAALRASHCKPWRDSKNSERLDPANGLLLVATLDALFDAGLIAFSDTGQMLTDASLTPAHQHALGLDAKPLRGSLTSKQREFIRYHRERVFGGPAGAPPDISRSAAYVASRLQGKRGLMHPDRVAEYSN